MLLLVTLCLYLPLVLWGFWSGAIDLIFVVILFILSIASYIVAVATLPIQTKQNRLIQILAILLPIGLCLAVFLVLWNIWENIFHSAAVGFLGSMSILGFTIAFGLLLHDKRMSRLAVICFTIGICALAATILQFANQGNLTRTSQRTINDLGRGIMSLCIGLIGLTSLPFHDLTSIRYKSLINNTLTKAQDQAIANFIISIVWLIIGGLSFYSILGR
jgi:hypothetical protein